MNSIIDYLEYWTAIQPDKCLSSFLDVHGKEAESYTYLGFHERSRYLAEYLSQQAGIKRGDRVLLVYPPGLEVIVAFYACARIGALPVPVSPPPHLTSDWGLAKLTFVAHDCEASAALTTRGLYRSIRRYLEQHRTAPLSNGASSLSALDWIATDDVWGQASASFRNDPSPILFLQYTSGSTNDPKGVIVSHENVIQNCGATMDHAQPIGVCWLPQHHDMGLIGYYLFPLITGGTTYGFSPMSFLKRPMLWLETLSRVRATYTSSPNFGFEYCLREDKIPPGQLENLDLSALRALMNAAEPVRADTYSRFLKRFAPHGLRPQAHVVAYGLAENTLAVSHYGRRIITVNKRYLQEGMLHIEDSEFLNNSQLHLVSCGRPIEGIQLRIVDPESHVALASGQIGEIWLAGKSTCLGYWNRPELTREVFGNSVVNDPEDHAVYLRTGDLGFLDDGELFVCGRIKDLIIIRGVNYYPQDIEQIVESASQGIRSGAVAAFEGKMEGEALIVMVEVKGPKNLPDPAAIARAIRTAYYVEPDVIVFVPGRTIVKTTSGKIARSLTRQRWLDDELPVLATYCSKEAAPAPDLAAGLRERLGHLLEPYNLTGNEDYTLAEIGIDSLTLVTLLTEIERLLEEHGATDLMNEVDGWLLQRLTVAEFFSLFDQFERISHEPLPALRRVLKQLKQERNDHEQECMRHDAALGPINLGSFSRTDAPLTSVLLTGATGFFGPFLLSSLLLRTPYTYYVLIRATDQVSGMNRIRDSLRRARVLTPALNEELERRVHVVCGDIAKRDLGLHPELWQSLTTRVQAVIHNAALVNYVLNYDALRPHNVDGTRELLRFSSLGTKKEFHLISSTIIFGWTLKSELLESDKNVDMLNLDFGYAQSKWVAEQLVFAAADQGLAVRVYRPSFISASTAGVASTNDIAIRLLAFMINHGLAVEAWNQISFLPADIAANNIAAIFRQRQIADRTFHVTVDGYYNMMDITQLLTREYGYPFAYYDIPSFVAEMKRRCTSDDLLHPLLDFVTRAHLKLAAMQHKRYHNDRYREARRLSGNGCTDPPLTDIVSYLVEYMLQEGIIHKPPLSRTAISVAAEVPLR